MKLLNFALDPVQSFSLIWSTTADEPEEDEISSLPEIEDLSPLDLANVGGGYIDKAAGSLPQETFVLYAQMKISSRTMMPTGSINHTSWLVADVAGPPLLDLDTEQWQDVVKLPSPKETLKVPHFPQLGQDEYIDLVIHNADDTGHPFHIVS